MESLGAYGLPFGLYVRDTDIHDSLRRHGIGYRQRVFDPSTTMWTWMAQIASQDRSCRHAVARVVAHRAAQGLPASAGTGGYVQARQRLDVRVIRDLARRLAVQVHARRHLWPIHPRPVVIVDSTCLSGPDTYSNQVVYPQYGGQADGLGFPAIKSLLAVCLDSAVIFDATISPIRGFGTHDAMLIHEVADWLPHGCLLVGDRAFGSYWNFALMKQRSVDFLARQRKGQDYRRARHLRHLKAHDHVYSVPRPEFKPKWMSTETYDAFIPSIELRMCAVRDDPRVHVRSRKASRTDRIRLLCTDTSGALSRAELGELYRRRWDIELDIRAFKIDLGADILRCQTSEMLEKELWMTVLTYNAVRALMADAASTHGLHPRQLSFKGTLQSLQAFGPMLDRAHAPDQPNLVYRLRAAIASHIVGNRPDRIEPRAVKRRPKPHALLSMPRDRARKAAFRERIAMNSTNR